MAGGNEESIVRDLLDSIGVTVNGDKPYDIQVHDNQVYRRVLGDGALGLGESYMDSWWDCRALDQFIERILRADLRDQVKGNWNIGWYFLKSKLFNLQNKDRAYQVGEQHYDTGNDLFEAMLNKRMNYTCAYWKNSNNLDEAQEAKLDLVCKKINLEPGMRVLELGCGFGSFAGYAAEKYGAQVTGVTVSKEQAAYGNERYKGLPVKLILEDYRSVSGQYDRVISIGSNDSVTAANAWSTKYIFPNGMLPSIAQLGKAMEGLFVMEDWHNFGPDYNKTLLAWNENFEKAWPLLKEKYSERFRRMWRYYLLSAAGRLRARDAQLWQIVMTRKGTLQPDRIC